MLPLFKSDFSIGKSILTLNSPNLERGTTSILDLAQEEKLTELILVEDSLTGFLKAHTACEELDIQLVFGLRLSMCGDMGVGRRDEATSTEHKIIIFARNSRGCKLLNKIYSLAFTTGEGRIDLERLTEEWDDTALKLCIPFYDSFLFKNSLSFSSCVVDFSFTTPTFFLETNQLPFDALVTAKVEGYAAKNNYPTQLVKSIYYKNRNDFAAYQTYKCVCSRSSYGRGATLSKPNLDHCGSKEFSFESWKDCK